ncbi:MAG TPA: DUF1206 domain-containing protein, partial [Fimbriimonadaceae bacterium]|nr:DUF1206 domain-containing protein [Fimbriimonadaceae bacterium]
MLSPQSSLEGLKRQAGSTLAEVQPWIERLARFGYVGKGVVYGLIGVLAFLAAIGPNGEATDRQGAISAIAAQPYGAPLLYALGVGLLGYALWRFLMAAYNPERRSGFKRVVYVVTGLVYGGLGVLAFDGAMGGKPKSDEVGWTAELMSQPFGRLLVMGLGVVVIAVGVAQFVNAAKCLFCDVLMRYRMNEA